MILQPAGRRRAECIFGKDAGVRFSLNKPALPRTAPHTASSSRVCPKPLLHPPAGLVIVPDRGRCTLLQTRDGGRKRPPFERAQLRCSEQAPRIRSGAAILCGCSDSRREQTRQAHSAPQHNQSNCHRAHRARALQLSGAALHHPRWRRQSLLGLRRPPSMLGPACHE
jgi:hypothetical protein